MANPFFRFKEFTVYHDRCAMKVTTDACLFGAWCAEEMKAQNIAHGLDVGTGTGLLSLMVAQKNSLLIDAIDIDENAAQQAAENIAASRWHSQINIVCADVVTYAFTKGYDVILSNPPFYEREIESNDVGKNTAHHSRGLKLTELLFCIKKNLKKDGSFYLLLPYKRWKELETAFFKMGLYIHRKAIVSPSVQHSPSRIMLQGGHLPADIVTHEIAIHDSNRNYTEEFKYFLKDYYLYL